MYAKASYVNKNMKMTVNQSVTFHLTPQMLKIDLFRNFMKTNSIFVVSEITNMAAMVPTKMSKIY